MIYFHSKKSYSHMYAMSTCFRIFMHSKINCKIEKSNHILFVKLLFAVCNAILQETFHIHTRIIWIKFVYHFPEKVNCSLVLLERRSCWLRVVPRYFRPEVSGENSINKQIIADGVGHDGISFDAHVTFGNIYLQ